MLPRFASWSPLVIASGHILSYYQISEILRVAAGDFEGGLEAGDAAADVTAYTLGPSELCPIYHRCVKFLSRMK